MRRVCFYHAGCPDGFGAAWAVWKRWGDGGEYRPRGHDDLLEPKEFAGAQVVFVDIAPPNDLVRGLAEHVDQLTVLDHHVSARDRYEAEPGVENALAGHGHLIHFDLDHSGAILAWQHFHPDETPPELLRYVEDVDLWRWKLPHSAQVNATLNSHRRSFEVWERLAATPIEQLAAEGEGMVRAQRIDVERSLQAAHPITLGEHRVEAVNAVFHRSSIGHELARRSCFGAPCGVVYRIQGRRVDVSIYSTGDFDVSRIAIRYGGGGHRNASGFHVSLEEWLARFV